MEKENLKAHRAACLKLVVVLLIIWFSVSFGAGIILRDQLDAFKIGNAPFGFWMAQQGSIICFIAILIIYAIRMNQLDKKHGFNEDQPEDKQNH